MTQKLKKLDVLVTKWKKAKKFAITKKVEMLLKEARNNEPFIRKI